MKKYFILLLIPVLAYIFWDKQESKSPAISTTRPIPQKVSKNKQQIFGKRPKLKPVATDANTDCDSFRDSLDDMDFMQEIDQWLTFKDVELLPGCLPVEFNPKIAEIKNNCFEKLNKEMCLTNMVMLRGILRAKLISHAETRSDLADVMMSGCRKCGLSHRWLLWEIQRS